MPEYETPGVYIDEVPRLPASIASVETAIPAFIGYTEKAIMSDKNDLLLRPHRISSMLEYERYFGCAARESSIEVSVDLGNPRRINVTGKVKRQATSKFLMYYSIQLFYANGGGPCYITSVGNYNDFDAQTAATDLKTGLDEVAGVDEVTLLLFPDGLNLQTSSDYYTLYKHALEQCAELQDRFAIMDVWINPAASADNIKVFRDFDFGSGQQSKFGAVYYPRVFTSIDFNFSDESLVKINGISGAGTLAELRSLNRTWYFLAKNAITNIEMLLPASSGVAGQYASIDNVKGVWKAPANVNIANCIRPEKIITDNEQAALNVDPVSGKSINVIRFFPGRGPAIIWGARTLAGNDNEWRYIPVRRFFNMVEESIRKGTEQFVFEVNDAQTWISIKSMVQNYLTNLWKAGALMGNTPRDAFFVKVGQGETMTEADILEGRLIVEVGMAVVRPAEFIILRFMHKVLSES
ncbi:MAG: phage tail sheath family protein [Chitinophagaceae bacterium]|nr:MAG: phage tail sheath family protein [Chitinophagaceae bacterium]